MKRLPSVASPRIATKTFPGFNFRESYSRPETDASPSCARTSTPSRSSRKFMGQVTIIGLPYAVQDAEEPLTTWVSNRRDFLCAGRPWERASTQSMPKPRGQKCPRHTSLPLEAHGDFCARCHVRACWGRLVARYAAANGFDL